MKPADAPCRGPMDDPGTPVDVAIVGAGPVGLVLALLLGQRGWRVQVLERRPGPYELPRAVHMDDETARVLQGIGVMATLSALTQPMDAYEWRNATGQVLLAITGGTGAGGWPCSLMFCQSHLQQALLERLRTSANVQVRWGWDVQGLQGGDAHAPIGLVAGGPAPQLLSAKWVIACDGANSSVRDLVGLTMQDFDFSRRWIVADFLTPGHADWAPLNLQICDPARPTTAVSGGPGRRRFEFLCLAGEDMEQMRAPATVWDLVAPWGLSASNSVLERSAGYSFSAAIATRWRGGPYGRVLLAGDAAHQMPPFAGQGLCAGVRDAANLAWKLDMVLSATAAEDLLATYESERHPLATEEIELSVALGEIVCMTDTGAATGRDAAMVPAALAGGPLSVPEQPFLPTVLGNSSLGHAGRVGLQAEVARGGVIGRCDDVLGNPRWALLSPHEDPCSLLPKDLMAWWEGIGGVGAQIAPGACTDDITGAYGRWFSQLGAAAVLQRPDYRLYGSAERIDEVPQLVASLRDSLGRG